VDSSFFAYEREKDPLHASVLLYIFLFLGYASRSSLLVFVFVNAFLHVRKWHGAEDAHVWVFSILSPSDHASGVVAQTRGSSFGSLRRCSSTILSWFPNLAP
jgi:hypothetical protein